MTKEEKKKLAASLDFVIKKLQENPKNIDLWISKANLYESLGEHQQSLETLLALADNLAIKEAKSQVLEMAVQAAAKYSLYKLGDIAAHGFLSLDPSNPKALFFAGMFAYRLKRPVEADSLLKRAVELAPENPSCLHFYGKAKALLCEQNRADELLFRSVKLTDELFEPRFDYTYNQLMIGAIDESKVLASHQALAKFVAGSQKPAFDFRSRPVGENRRLGFVSGDYYSHSVSYFLYPLLKQLREKGFEVNLYSVTQPKNYDYFTEKLQSVASVWRDLFVCSASEMAQQIYDDDIDILFDLTGYMGVSRLACFASKPAPIQIAYIGYPYTTAMAEIDYRIVDSYTDPLGLTEAFTSENLLRLEKCFLCYSPDEAAPDVSPLPAISEGGVCFGAFNNSLKITSEVLDAWATILQRVSGARLLIKSGPLHEEAFRERLYSYFERFGVTRERIELVAWTRDKKEHLELYSKVDIHLDTFPYNGATTTCEAAWQGVPTVTFRGDSHRARVGNSLMSNLGLQEFVGDNVDDYVRIAVKKALDLDALSMLREGMRERMISSPLMDETLYGTEMAGLLSSLKPRACSNFDLQ